MGRDQKTWSLSRRKLVAGAVALVAASTLPPAAARTEDEEQPAPNAIPPREALERLKQGNARYAAGETKEADYAFGAAPTTGQYPIAAVLSCSESPVPPEIIFDQAPGDLFVVRNAGNVVSTYALASMEYAVKYLGVPLIFVLGNSGSGVVAMALGATRLRKQLPGHLSDIVKSIETAVVTAHGRHPGDFLAAAIEENVRLGIKRLKTRSETVGGAVSSGAIEIKGGVFDSETGVVKLV